MALTHQISQPYTFHADVDLTYGKSQVSLSVPGVVQLRAVPIYGKMAGAVGNYNAHISAYPDVQWDAVADEFVSGLGLQLNPYVTQVWLIAHR